MQPSTNIVPQEANPALRRLIVRLSFKSFYVFYLGKTYGGVPIIDHLPNPSSDEDRVMQLTRRTSAEVYAFIESDLQMLLLLYLINQYMQLQKRRAEQLMLY
jgi:hypothetical protein